MTVNSIQTSFVGGEVSPQLYGRVDLAKYKNGASTMRNMFVNYRGGASSRAGLAYVGMCKQGAPNAGGTATSNPPRDIPFQFSLTQGYALEFGDQYMRIKSNGNYVTEAQNAITGITQGNPGSFSYSNTNYTLANGDWVFITGVGGMTNFNGLTWIVQNATSTSFTVTDLFGTVQNTLSFPLYASGGTLARIYTPTAPYAAIDLPYLKFTQSADTMTLCCVNQQTSTEYPSYELVRNGATNWTFTQDTFSTSIAAPTGLVVSAHSSTTVDTFYSYRVTSVDNTTGEESEGSIPASVENNNISIYAGSNSLTWTPVANAVSYNVYRAVPAYGAQVPAGSLYSYIGFAYGPSFTDGNITADATRSPPVHTNPFARGQILFVTPTNVGSGLSQGTVGYTINTSTGSGFLGFPIIVGGTFVAMDIENPGQNYQPGDTITITGSSGSAASGSYTFTANPTNGQTVVLNGITFTFVTSGATGTQINILTTPSANLGALYTAVESSASTNLTVASYGISGLTLTITYKTVGTAGNAYTLGGTYPGTPSGATLTGGMNAGGTGGAAATLTIGPESGTYPGDPAYYQQRRVYANTLDNPDTYYMSQPGAYSNMDVSTPIVDSDAISGTPWAQQVNGIQFMVPMTNGLVTLTGSGAWLVNGGNSAAITPADQTAQAQAYNGSSATVPPIVVNYDILYVQSKGSIVRDLSYNFFSNIFTGTDMTVLSNHLFLGHTIVQWAYCEEPYKLIWAVRDDGILLCLTYLKEQDVYSWSRHDTNGLVAGVCSVTEPPVDALYAIVKRYVRGVWVYYSERMDNRIWENVESCFCVDAGLSYPMQFPAATLTVSGTTGTVTLTVPSAQFTPAIVGDVIRVGGGKITVTNYVSPTTLTGTVTQTITNTIPNDPNNTVTPAVSGTWSISTPTTTVSGLNHLEGLTVTGIADGGVLVPQAVTNGTITLPAACSSVTVGLAYLPQLQALYLDAPIQGGTMQGKRKDIYSLTVRMNDSRGFSAGTNQPDQSTQPNMATVTWTNMKESKERNALVNAGTAIPLFTGDYYILVPGDWNTGGQVAIENNYPLPLNVLAVVINYASGDTNS